MTRTRAPEVHVHAAQQFIQADAASRRGSIQALGRRNIVSGLNARDGLRSHYTSRVKTGSHLAQSIRKRPIAAFLVIVFAISYPLGMAFNVFVSSTLAPSSLLGVYLPRLLTVWGPAAAALLVAASGAGSIRV